jgi:HAD superfamily hydrolase (TIGR01544 family)
MENVLITNQKNFEELKEKFKKDGVEKLHVLADFDKTLTYAFVDGKKIASLVSVLRDNDYLTPDYPEKAHALFNKYYPIEKDLNISIEEKKKAMKRWWTEHFDLLIQSKLNIKDIEKAVENQDVKLRDGCIELLNFMKDNNIPLVILSSSGLGKESIKLYLEKRNFLFDNINIISNSFIWNKEGYAVDVKKPVIHTLSKNETVVRDFPEIFEKVKDRKNVILLGDSVSDTEMIAGFDYDNLIKIGFLNEDIQSNLAEYKKAFDVIIIKDSSVDFLNDLLKEIYP